MIYSTHVIRIMLSLVMYCKCDFKVFRLMYKTSLNVIVSFACVDLNAEPIVEIKCVFSAYSQRLYKNIS